VDWKVSKLRIRRGEEDRDGKSVERERREIGREQALMKDKETE